MLVFLSSMRHPQTAKDYAQVERMFELCARSVCSQSTSEFRFVVVCHKKPNIDFTHENIIYHIVDWPPARAVEGQANFHSHYDIDKGLKIVLASLRAREVDPRFFFIIDADDWVSSRLASFVNNQASKHGFVVDRGHFVDWALRSYKRRRGLNRYCGSTICPSKDLLFSVFPDLARTASLPTREQVLREAGASFLEHSIGAHRMPRYFASRGANFDPLPFFSAAWVTNTGENNMGQLDTSVGRPIDARFCNQYGLEPKLASLQRGTTLGKMCESIAYAKANVAWWMQCKSGRESF